MSQMAWKNDRKREILLIIIKKSTENVKILRNNGPWFKKARLSEFL